MISHVLLVLAGLLSLDGLPSRAVPVSTSEPVVAEPVALDDLSFVAPDDGDAGNCMGGWPPCAVHYGCSGGKQCFKTTAGDCWCFLTDPIGDGDGG